MKCTNCGKEFQTYNGICPYCHSKNKKDVRAELNIRNIPYQESRPPIPLQAKRLTERVNTNTPIKSRSSNQTLKYALGVGMGLFVVLCAAAMTQSFLGGSSLSASVPGIYVSPTPTDIPIPSLPPLTSSTLPKITFSKGKAGTLSPYSVDPNSITRVPHATEYVAPGYRTLLGGPSPGSTSDSAMVRVTPYPIVTVTSSSDIFTAPDPSTVTTAPSPVSINPPPVIENPNDEAPASTSDTCCICSYDAYNCDDPESLTCYYYCYGKGGKEGNREDIHGLDGDNDGEPCEGKNWDIGSGGLCGPPKIDTITTITTPPPKLLPKPPVILSVNPEQSTVTAGETIRIDVLVESEVPVTDASCDLYNPIGMGSPNPLSIQTTTLGNNQWKMIIPISTDEYWPIGVVEIDKLYVYSSIIGVPSVDPSAPWPNRISIRVNNRHSPEETKPAVVSIASDKGEINAGEGVYLTILVKSKLPVGHYGFSHYAYSSPDGRGLRTYGGLGYTKVGEDIYEAKIRIQTHGDCPTGDIVFTELIVNNAAEQSSDPITPVKVVHIIGSSGATTTDKAPSVKV